METIILQQIHEDLLNLKKEVSHIKILIEEDLELSDDVVREIKDSRKRPKEEFISHEEMRKEFG